jgi:hypothetical protein
MVAERTDGDPPAHPSAHKCGSEFLPEAPNAFGMVPLQKVYRAAKAAVFDAVDKRWRRPGSWGTGLRLTAIIESKSARHDPSPNHRDLQDLTLSSSPKAHRAQGACR